MSPEAWFFACLAAVAAFGWWKSQQLVEEALGEAEACLELAERYKARRRDAADVSVTEVCAALNRILSGASVPVQANAEATSDKPRPEGS